MADLTNRQQFSMAGTADGEGLATTFIAGIYYLALQLTWKKYGFYYLKVINGVYSCIFASRQRLGCHKRLALTKMRTDQSFDHCSPGWRTTLPRKRRAPARLQVGVGAPELFPQTAKDHF